MININKNFYQKIFIVICLLCAIYITITCPCKILLSCNLYTFYILLGLSILYVIYLQIK